MENLTSRRFSNICGKGRGEAGRESRREEPFCKKLVEEQKNTELKERGLAFGFALSLASSVTFGFSLSGPFWGPPPSRPQLPRL